MEYQNQEPQLPFAATWGLDSPVMNMGAYFGLSIASNILGGGRSRLPLLSRFNAAGRAGSLSAQMSKSFRAPNGRFVSGAKRTAKMWEMRRAHGSRWMARMGAKDVMSPKLLDRYARRYGGVGAKNFINRAVARRAGMSKGITRTFGKSMANRIGMYRGISGALSLANTALAGYMGAQMLSSFGEMVANWVPTPAMNARRQLETGGPIIDTGTAYTQRQRSIQAIHNSQISTRAALGMEASFMHDE